MHATTIILLKTTVLYEAQKFAEQNESSSIYLSFDLDLRATNISEANIGSECGQQRSLRVTLATVNGV